MTSQERFMRWYMKQPGADCGGTVWMIAMQSWAACEAEMREVMDRVAVCFAVQLIQARGDVEVISGKPLDQIIDEEMNR